MLAVWDTLSIARKGIGLDTFELSVEQNARIEQNLGPIGRLEPTMDALLESMGFTMVRVQLMGRESPTLQIMAERLDGLPMTADNCADISRALSPLLESEDPITEAYNLEVSSPGIDRPLTRAFDFVRFAGHLVKVENRFEIEGRRRFTGRGAANGREQDQDCSQNQALAVHRGRRVSRQGLCRVSIPSQRRIPIIFFFQNYADKELI